jgi:hypothetical protein
MVNSAWPKGTGTAAGPADPYPRWERPDPPRLNDTSAIQRKGTYNYVYAHNQCDCSPCETPYVPENTFNTKSLPMMGACGPYGAGAVIAMRTRYANGSRNGGRVADGNSTVPGNRSSLATAIGEIPKEKA